MNTFIKVNITHVGDILEDKSIPLQKGLPSPFRLARNRIHLDTQLKEELTNLF